jgi:hypothetical protein
LSVNGHRIFAGIPLLIPLFPLVKHAVQSLLVRDSLTDEGTPANETRVWPLQDNMNDTRSGGADLRRMRRPNRAPRFPNAIEVVEEYRATGESGIGTGWRVTCLALTHAFE